MKNFDSINQEELVGKRVLIKKGHPWVGEVGVVESFDKTLSGLGMKVNLDNGFSCYVFKSYHFKLI